MEQKKKTLVLTTNGAKEIKDFAYIIKCRENDFIYYAHQDYKFVFSEFAKMALVVLQRGEGDMYNFVIE